MRTVTLALSSVPPARPTPAPGATAATTSARLRPALLSTATTGPISRQAAPRGQPPGMASASTAVPARKTALRSSLRSQAVKRRPPALLSSASFARCDPVRSSGFLTSA